VRKGDNKIFNDKKRLYGLVELRRAGWSISTLSILFNCDRTSIRLQCDKYGIIPWSRENYPIKNIIIPIIRPLADKNEDKWVLIDGERINQGKSYKDYLREYKLRISP